MRGFGNGSVSSGTVHASESLLGTVNVVNDDTLVLWVDYSKGDEAGVYLVPKLKPTGSGTEHDYMEWSSDAASTRTAKRFYLTASCRAYISLDVSGVSQVRVYDEADGGTPTGVLGVDFTVQRSSS